MNYPTKIQAIRRKKTVSQCYVNLPLPLAAAIDIHPVKWWSGKLILVTNSGSSANGPTRKKEKNPKGFFSKIILVIREESASHGHYLVDSTMGSITEVVANPSVENSIPRRID